MFKEQLHIRMDMLLVAFERENIVAFLLYDLRSNSLLAAHCIESDGAAGNVKKSQ